MGGLSYLVQRREGGAGPQPAQSPLHCAKYDSPPINGQCANHCRSRHTWIRTVEDNLRPADIGLHTAWRRAQNRSDCRTLVRTAALQYGHAIDDDDDVLQGARVEVWYSSYSSLQPRSLLVASIQVVVSTWICAASLAWTVSKNLSDSGVRLPRNKSL